MKCDNCNNPATMHKHYEKSDGTFADSHLCDDCFFNEYMLPDADYVCAWCGESLNGFVSPAEDKQHRKYCSYECMRRFMGYEDVASK